MAQGSTGDDRRPDAAGGLPPGRHPGPVATGRRRPAAATEAPMADAMADLIAAAQAEGGLTTIALPHDWCNYGEVISSFTEKYGIPINALDPNARSGDDIEAVKAHMNHP